MSNNLDLEAVIEDSVNDALLPEDTLESTDTSADTTEVPEVQPEPTTTDSEPVEASTNNVTESPEVKSPGAKEVDSKPADDFEKKYGIPALNAQGRENRIPYGRVKKINEKAVADERTRLTKELETTHVPVAKFQELEATVKDQTDRLTKVAEFEGVMLNDAPRFLDMLSTIPAYAKIFKDLQTQAEAKPIESAKPEATSVDANDPMPQPDQELTDGSFVYSMKGLEALNAWNRAQARKEILKEVETRFGPLESDYKQYQARQAAIPQVQAQIAEARTWPLFNENEEDIVKTLQQYPTASLERAYQHVVFPKLQAEQEKLKKEIETKTGEAKINEDTVRAKVIAELKKAPKATSVSTSGSKPSQSDSKTPKSLEDVIAESVKASGLKG